MDDNLFDEDDALDYALAEECLFSRYSLRE
jgi:hypothetical protein